MLRGQGPEATILIGEVFLTGNATLRDLHVQDNAGPVALIISASDGERVEVDNVVVAASVGAGTAAAVSVEQGGAQTFVVLRDCRLLAAAQGGAVGVLDRAGVQLSISDTFIAPSSANVLAIGIRLGDPANRLPSFSLRTTNVRIALDLSSGFAAGIETNAAGGAGRVTHTEVRTTAGGARALSVNGGDVRVLDSLFFTDDPLFASTGVIKLAGTGIEGFTGNIVDPTSISGLVQCVGSYQENTFTPLDAQCAPL